MVAVSCCNSNALNSTWHCITLQRAPTPQSCVSQLLASEQRHVGARVVAIPAAFIRSFFPVLWATPHTALAWSFLLLEQVVRTLLARLKEQANTRFAVSALEEPAYGAMWRQLAKQSHNTFIILPTVTSCNHQARSLTDRSCMFLVAVCMQLVILSCTSCATGLEFVNLWRRKGSPNAAKSNLNLAPHQTIVQLSCSVGPKQLTTCA